MSDSANETLVRIAVSGVQKCVEKLSRVSAGVWNISGVDVNLGTLADSIRRHGSDDEESSAVYFDVKGDLPFISMILFDPRDISGLSRCFLGSCFAVPPALTQPGDPLLSELGNIILNSFISALSRELGRIFLPSPPKCLRGGPQDLLEALGMSVDSERCRIVSIKLDIRCGKNIIRSEVLGLIPEKLAGELLKIKDNCL
jgi:chemotaxis protein CheY-P-specific phosphatase CheC